MLTLADSVTNFIVGVIIVDQMLLAGSNQKASLTLTLHRQTLQDVELNIQIK